MSYIGASPPSSALTASDIADGIISVDKLATNAVTQVKVADDAIALAELKAGTDGELITWDASGNPAAVAAGSSGEFLKSQGAGSVPVFAAAGGDVVKISTTTASGSAAILTIDNCFDDTTYNYYKVFFKGLALASGTSDETRFRLLDSSGSVLTASEWRGAVSAFDVDGSGNSGFRQPGTTIWDLNYLRIHSHDEFDTVDYNTTNVGQSGEMTIFNPENTSYKTIVQWYMNAYNSDASTDACYLQGMGFYDVAGDNRGISFYTNGGDNFYSTFTVTVYGFKA